MGKMKRGVISVFSVPVVLFLLTGCRFSTDSQKENKIRNEIVLKRFFHSPPATLDPANAFDSISGHMITQLYDRLFELNEFLEPKPHLLESYFYVPENKTYHFTLKKGVRFSNGQELTSKDIIFTFQRFCNSKRKDWKITEVITGCMKTGNGHLANDFGVRALNAYDFVIQLNSHYPPFLVNLASPHFSIILSEFGGKDEVEYFKAPITTGPYILEKQETREVRILSNPSYFLGKPVIDKVVYRIVTFEEARELALQGELDDLWPMTPSQAPSQLYKPYKTRFAAVCFLSFNLRKPPYNKLWFRKALEALIDRENIVNAIASGSITKAYGFVPYGILGYQEEPKSPSPNHELAKIYIKKAGFQSFNQVPELTLFATKSKWSEIYVPEIVNQLKNVGLKVSVHFVNLEEYVNSLKGNKIDFSVSTIQLNQPDTYHLLEIFKSTFPLDPYKISSPYFDQLLEKSQKVEDRLERGELYRSANSHITKNVWAISLFYHLYDTSFIKKEFQVPPINHLGPDFLSLRSIGMKQ